MDETRSRRTSGAFDAVDAETSVRRPGAPVSVIITCFNHGCWLADAITSVLEQTYHPIELIVVDDGSTDDTATVCRFFPEARYLYQPNAGLPAARNEGLRVSTGVFVCFLDADDLLLPHAIATGVAALEEHRSWAFAYGGYTRVTADRRVIHTVRPAPGEVAYRSLLRSNSVGMHATVLYRRRALQRAGDFDITLSACEDYDMLLRIARSCPAGSHGVTVAEYRQHGANMSLNAELMLASSLRVLRAQEGSIRCPADRAAVDAGADVMKRYYGTQMIRQALADLARPSRTAGALRRLDLARRLAPQAYLTTLMAPPRAMARAIYHRLPGSMARRVRSVVDRAAGKPARGRVDFGDLRRLEPIDPDFGFGRGLPIDRFYVEDFLARHAGDVAGRVLEVEDNRYTRRFGGSRVARSEVINITPDSPHTTIVADLTEAPQIEDGSFDCIILTQTLQYIYEAPRALDTLQRILRPGGVLLLTVPALSKVDRDERREGWYWLVTAAGLRRLLGAGWTDVSIETYGNVLSAVSFLHGVAAEELTRPELMARDECYQVVVAARATKPEA